MEAPSSSVVFSNYDDYTTTPWERIGAGEPLTNTSLEANLFFRVFLGIISTMTVAVPARLLWKNGEFPATVFCVVTMLLNIMYVVNSLMWPDDNVKAWPTGIGWCDLQSYVGYPLLTVYNICLFEIMRSLANKVGISRVTSLSRAERRRRHLVSALVIFTVPSIQIMAAYFVLTRRFNVSTLIGCTKNYSLTWPFLLFFVLPSPIYIVGAAVMAIVVYRRFRGIEQSTREIIHHADSVVAIRQQRIRRKLYFITLAVLVVVLPTTLILFIANIVEGLPTWALAYDYHGTHFGPDPFNSRFISFTTSEKLGFGDVNVNYIPALTAVPIFIAFGTTVEAYNQYRRCLVLLGLGHVFPHLHQEYHASSHDTCKPSWWASIFSTMRGSHDGTRAGHVSPFPIAAATRSRLFFFRTPADWCGHSKMTQASSLPSVQVSMGSRFDASDEATQLVLSSPGTAQAMEKNPWLDVGDDVVMTKLSNPDSSHPRNPFLFRTGVAAPVKFPPLRMRTILGRGEGGSKKKAATETSQDRKIHGEWQMSSDPVRAGVETKVWSPVDEGDSIQPHGVDHGRVRVVTKLQSSTESLAGRRVE